MLRHKVLLLSFAACLLVVGTATQPAFADIMATNSTTGLFDASSGTRTVAFDGTEAGYGTGQIFDVNISINFAKADGESFDPPYPGGTPFYNEIHFHLTSPGGTVVHLIEPSSWGAGSGQFDGTITFDDEAGSVVNFGAAPVAGSFRPTGPGALSDYDSLTADSALGTWTLFIQDTVGLDALRFRSFTLNIATAASAVVVPEPATLVSCSIGVIGLLGYAWRRRKRAVA